MELHLAQLLTNNDPPSEVAIHEVKELLVSPLQELEETDTEIANLEARVKSLKEKRGTIQNSIDKYRTILSPVRRIDTDILPEIFYHCLPTHRNSIMSASEAPVLLARVCSSWRTVALSSPRLWAQLHIIFTDGSCVLASPENSNGDDPIRQTLELRCAVVSEWLMRSGTCPLSISICYSGNWLETVDEEDLIMELFKILLRFSLRWRSLELKMPVEIYRNLDVLVSKPAHTLPALTGLKLNFHERVPHLLGIGSEQPHIALLKAPHLNKVSLSSPSSGLWAFGPIPCAEWANNLTYLCCHIMCSVDDAFKMLKQCGNLIHCKLGILPHPRRSVNPPIQNPDNIIWTHGVASLPHLRALWIIEDSGNHGAMSHFYSSLDAPGLKWINYQKRLTHSFGAADIDVTRIFPLLQKSIELKKLNIEPRSFLSVDLHRVLETVSPTLTHLVLGEESKLGSLRAPSKSRGRSFVTRTSAPFDLKWLVVNQELEVNSNTVIPRQSILLPRLEILESTVGVDSDDALLRFITGRRDHSSPNGVAALKRVRIMFDRMKEVDVVEEVARYQDEKIAASGAWLDEIKLDLDYLLDPPNEIQNPLSASYGIKDNQSWNFLEINESMVPN